MKTQIVKGWTNGTEEYRVYVNQLKAVQFSTYQEAFLYVEKLKQLSIEKATVADDEDQSA
jgi:lipase chaperone LimK